MEREWQFFFFNHINSSFNCGYIYLHIFSRKRRHVLRSKRRFVHIVNNCVVIGFDALEYHALCAKRHQIGNNLAGLVRRNCLAAIGFAGEQRRLGEVRKQNVGTMYQLFCSVAQLLRIRCIHHAAVAHNGVHHVQRLRVGGVQLLYDVYLLT